jgi:hypothetical protein
MYMHGFGEQIQISGQGDKLIEDSYVEHCNIPNFKSMKKKNVKYSKFRTNKNF